MKRGDNYNIECPHCGKINHYVCQGKTIEFRKIKVFSKPCYHCKKEVYYSARYDITVTAEQDPIFEKN